MSPEAHAQVAESSMLERKMPSSGNLSNLGLLVLSRHRWANDRGLSTLGQIQVSASCSTHRAPVRRIMKTKGSCKSKSQGAFASFIFEETHDLICAAWRMRVPDFTILHHFVEELETQNFLGSHTVQTRERVLLLASAAPRVIRRSAFFLRSEIFPSLWPSLWTHEALRSRP